MSIVFFVLILIIATVFSNALDTKIKFLPRAIIQIMMGLALLSSPISIISILTLKFSC